MRFFIILLAVVTAIILSSSFSTAEADFIPSCEAGSFLVCHYFPESTDDQIPIELCVSGDNLEFHLQYYTKDTQGSCPVQPTPGISCPLECGTTCSSACLDLINTTTTNSNTNGLDCCGSHDHECDVSFCQGYLGDLGRDGTDGLRCWDQNENHQCDLETEDRNNDEECTLQDCQGETTTDENGECLCSEPIKLCCYVSMVGSNPPSSGSSPILGQVRWIAWKNCERDLQGHAPCQGQLVAATQNSVLFSLMHTKYGGDGVVTFALPDFRNMKM